MALLTPERAQELSEGKWADIAAGKSVSPASSCGWCLFTSQYMLGCELCPATEMCSATPRQITFRTDGDDLVYIAAAQQVLDCLVENREALIAAGYAIIMEELNETVVDSSACGTTQP